MKRNSSLHELTNRPCIWVSFSGKKRRGKYLVETTSDLAEETVGNSAILTVGRVEVTLDVGNARPEYEHCQ